MGIVSRTVSLYYTYKFIKILVTPWESTPAVKMGLIDSDGKKIRSPETSEEKDEYTLFHRLAFNIKRAINKVPFGKSMFASIATALLMLREHYNIDENKALATIKEEFGHIDYKMLTEQYRTVLEDAPTNSTGPAIQLYDKPLAIVRRKKKREQLRSFREWSKAANKKN